MDVEFEAIRAGLADINVALNETARDEHIENIERFTRTLKELMQATYHNTLPFKRIPGVGVAITWTVKEMIMRG
jgi:hypothetical protein